MEAEDRLLAQALRSATDPAFITDSAGRIVWVNQAFTALYGHAAETVVGQNPRILQSGRQGPRYYAALWRAIQHGHPWSEQVVDQTADGRQVTVRQTISPLRTEGRITHFLAIHTDVSKEAEELAIAQQRQPADTITGLYGRAAFESHCRNLLEREGVAGRHVDFMLIGVERQSGGAPRLDAHAESYLLGILGERIRRALRREAVVGAIDRFDFAMLLPDARADNERLGARLIAAIREPLPLHGDELLLTCYVAFARFPEDGRDIHALHRAADARMQQQQPLARPATPGATSDAAIERD